MTADLVQRTFAEACRAGGLDLVAFAPSTTLNVAVEAPHRLAPFARDEALCAVVGNTRALWPKLLDALLEDPAMLASSDPLDDHVARVVDEAARRAAVPTAVRFAHLRPFPPIQRFAEAAGLASLGACRLAVHPEHGAWIALRAVVVFDVEAPPAPPAPAPPCGHCERACAPLLRAALAEPSWRAFLAMREACPLGARARYDDDQIAYHYTKDRGALESALTKRRAERARHRR